MVSIIYYRLRIDCGYADDGVTFASLVQWFSLFYNGILSEKRFSDAHVGFGTAEPHPSHFQIVWRSDLEFAQDEAKIKALSYALRDETFSRLSLDTSLIWRLLCLFIASILLYTFVGGSSTEV